MITVLRHRIMVLMELIVPSLLIGMAMYVYNDWRTHLSLAAPQTHSQPTQAPLQLPDKNLNGTVQLGPNGAIKQIDD